ncbi:uncharacterized protein F4822DRAFT_367672 [Hypoxylon trugodes]|uniref:uncharacterized protein n=1 Tax=Hypoxylon trugodes TaxID=326681 RepID=UPI00219ABB1D|nr:uncharacterized protein F4822DRAFT_367672 [Hypoxylon trugodes]KAI1384594.1 hypothetical protein F4822DRAFT_367672 [Hypoxylon trugodes]
MEPTTIQQRGNLGSSLPFRTLKPHSSQLNIGRFPNTRYENVDNTIRVTDFSEAPFSPISERSSSFSQASTAETWDLASTEPSSPRSPRTKHEFDDIPRLGSISPHAEVLKRKCDSADEGSKRIKLQPLHLPSVSRLHLLPPRDNKSRRFIQPHYVKRALQTPNSSPEPRNEYTLSEKASDPIIQWLNVRRRESSDTKQPLSEPRGLVDISLNINLDVDETPPPCFYREKQKYTSQSRQQQQQQQPTPLLGEKGKAKRKRKGNQTKSSHNNIKYTAEEGDFIRYNKYEMKYSWADNQKLFVETFPMRDPEKDRRTQGVQGVHYRDNQHVPVLVDGGRRLVFNEYGHVKARVAQVRQQRDDKPYFSLVYLYPERALNYPWVADKFKKMAAELVKERIPQREAAKRDAIARGVWKEKLGNGECACCHKPDRERDNHKRYVPGRDESSFVMPTPLKNEVEPDSNTTFNSNPLQNRRHTLYMLQNELTQITTENERRLLQARNSMSK